MVFFQVTKITPVPVSCQNLKYYYNMKLCIYNIILQISHFLATKSPPSFATVQYIPSFDQFPFLPPVALWHSLKNIIFLLNLACTGKLVSLLMHCTMLQKFQKSLKVHSFRFPTKPLFLKAVWKIPVHSFL